MKKCGGKFLFILIFLMGQLLFWGGCAQQSFRSITAGTPTSYNLPDPQTSYPFLFLEEGLTPAQRFQKINDNFAYGCGENLRLIRYVQKNHAAGDRGDTLSHLKDAMNNIIKEGRLPTPYFKENSENETVKTIKPPVLIKYVYFTLNKENSMRDQISHLESLENFCSTVEDMSHQMTMDWVKSKESTPLPQLSILALLHKSIFRYFVSSLDPYSYIVESPERWYIEQGLIDQLRRSHLENVPNVFISSRNPFYDKDILSGPFWKTEWLFQSSALRIEFTFFDEGTAATFEREYRKYVNEKSPSALVIDLRRNRGGDALVVAKLLDLFLKQGELLLMREKEGEAWALIRDRNGAPFMAQPDNELPGIENIPVIILVSRYSSSSSETFAAAMQDHEAAIVIGEKTHGKGTGQRSPILRQLPLDIESSAKLTFTTIYTFSPKGNPIQLSGIDPDISVEDRDYVSRLITSGDQEDYVRHREDQISPPFFASRPLPTPDFLSTGFEPRPNERTRQWKEKLKATFDSHQNLFSLSSLAEAVTE